ncbi:hypothetical protein ACFVIM_30385 [Streptomyces sp. NPDC057638]|uniref:SCO6745 family protein n=1 Tax=Streptomyces sp. NPDC057638 TaxID=3346190 RepID=UPI00367A098D
MTTDLTPARAGRRCQDPLNTLHATVYFSPDTARELDALGVTGWGAAYFATRAAAMGAVGPGPVTAAFYNFSHDHIARFLPSVWESASPEKVLAARWRAADATLRRLLGEEVLAAAHLTEAATLAARATEGCSRPGRPLYAAHADLPRPDEPHLALWHAATLLREHRGDSHTAALLAVGLDPLEAVVSHTATGRGMSPRWVLSTRGWRREDWDAAAARLRERGLLDPAGALTAQGTAVRAELEALTDRLDSGPYTHLGAAGVERLTALGRELAGRALSAGAFPADLVGAE